MIRYLPYNSIDLQRWDHCIARSANPLIYGFAWYLDQVCETWDGLVLDDYIAVFPLPWKQKFGVRYLYTPWFVQKLGIFSTVELTPGLVDEFIDSIPRSFRFADLLLNAQSFPGHHPTTVRHNYELSLTPSYEEISRGYSTNLKRNLKTAGNGKLTVTSHPDTGQVVNLFRNNRGAAISHWTDTDYLRFKALFHALEHKGMARGWGVYSPQNELIAGAIFFFDPHRAIFIFSGMSAEGRENGAMPLLIDRVIREFAGTAMILDFEGSMDPGLARFYGSFGASLTHYWFLRLNRLPFPLKQWVNILKKK